MGLVPTRTWTMALDPTFEKFYLIRTNFTLGELVSLVKVFHLDPTFGKFYLVRTNFTLGELVSLVVKVFRLFRFEWIVLVFRVGRCTSIFSLLAGPACL